MKVERTIPGIFQITDVTITELEILQEALIAFEGKKLKDILGFKSESQMCEDMYSEIDSALIKFRY